MRHHKESQSSISSDAEGAINEQCITDSRSLTADLERGGMQLGTRDGVH